MKSYLSFCENPRSALNSNELPILKRKSLLLAMLADRSIPRFICAPKWYGKSLLAYQYAQLFSSTEVLWVDSCDPVFIGDLDNCAFDLSDTVADSVKLVVFDDLPFLNAIRLSYIFSVIKHLCECHLEVVITTSFRMFADSYEDDKMVVSAQDMLLSDEEVDDLSGEYNYASIDKRIPAWALGGSAKRRQIVQTIISSPIHDRLDALSRLMLVVGQGTVSELSRLFSTLYATDLGKLRRDFPHCGLSFSLFSFKALGLDVMQRFDLLQRHLEQFVFYSERHNTSSFLGDLLIVLKDHRDWDLMSLVMLRLCERDQRTTAILDVVPTLLFEGLPCLALGLFEGIAFDERLKSEIVLLELATYSSLHDEQRCRELFDKQCEYFSSCDAAYACILLLHAEGRLDKTDRERFIAYCNDAGIGPSTNLVRDENRDLLAEYNDVRSLICSLVLTCLESFQDGLCLYKALLAAGLSLRTKMHMLAIVLWVAELIFHDALSSLQLNQDEIDDFCESAQRLLKRSAMMLEPNCCETAILHYLAQVMRCNLWGTLSNEMQARYKETEAIYKDQIVTYRSYRPKRRRYYGMHADVMHAEYEEYVQPVSDQMKVDNHQVFDLHEGLLIRVFGGFEMKTHGDQIPQQKNLRTHAKALLVLLLIHRNRELPREWIEKTIWHNSRPEHARQSFYNVWSYTRRTLETYGIDSSFMSLSRGVVAFDSQDIQSDLISLDTIAMQKDIASCSKNEVVPLLQSVLCLYKGKLLPGCDIPQIEIYRNSYHNKVIALLHDGAKRLRSMNEAILAERIASKAFSLDEAREDTCCTLMEIKRDLGQRSSAIMVFVAHRQRLVDKFGIDPSKRLYKLYEDILEEVS